MSERPHVTVLAGGPSLEREVSLRSGARVADALDDLGYPTVRLDVGSDLVSALTSAPTDVVFLALHGAVGEDGTIQSILDLLGMPYTGSDAHASALAWHKPVAKGVFRRAGLATPESVTISARALRDLGVAPALDRVGDALGSPLVVKPGAGGSALGVTHVARIEDLPAAIVHALSYDETALIERAIAGTEVAVALLDGEPLPPVEIVPREGDFDFAARYTPGATAFHVPARLPEDVLADCTAAAVGAYRATGCRDLARADLVIDADGIPWLLELDTCPGLTDTSLVPAAAAAAGLAFPALVERLVDLTQR